MPAPPRARRRDGTLAPTVAERRWPPRLGPRRAVAAPLSTAGRRPQRLSLGAAPRMPERAGGRHRLAAVSGQRPAWRDEKKGIDRLRAHGDVGLLWPRLGTAWTRSSLRPPPPHAVHAPAEHLRRESPSAMHSYAEAPRASGPPRPSSARSPIRPPGSARSQRTRRARSPCCVRGADAASPLHAALGAPHRVCASTTRSAPKPGPAAGEDQWTGRGRRAKCRA